MWRIRANNSQRAKTKKFVWILRFNRATLQRRLKFRKSFSIGRFFLLGPTQHNTNTRTPVGPTKDISFASEEKLEEVC